MTDIPFREPQGIEARTAAFLSALERLPPSPGVTFRGRPDGIGAQRGTIVTRLITATSRDIRVATAGFTTGGVYAVAGRSGRRLGPFSAMPEAEEVVFAPGCVLVCGPSFDVDGLEVTPVDEIPLDSQGHLATSDLDVEVLQQRVTDHIRRVRAVPTEPAVPPESCARFIGGLE